MKRNGSVNEPFRLILAISIYVDWIQIIDCQMIRLLSRQGLIVVSQNT